MRFFMLAVAAAAVNAINLYQDEKKMTNQSCMPGCGAATITVPLAMPQPQIPQQVMLVAQPVNACPMACGAKDQGLSQCDEPDELNQVDSEAESDVDADTEVDADADAEVDADTDVDSEMNLLSAMR